MTFADAQRSIAAMAKAGTPFGEAMAKLMVAADQIATHELATFVGGRADGMCLPIKRGVGEWTIGEDRYERVGRGSGGAYFALRRSRSS